MGDEPPRRHNEDGVARVTGVHKDLAGMQVDCFELRRGLRQERGREE